MNNVKELYEDAAIYSNRMGLEDMARFLASVNIDREDWDKFNIEDITETYKAIAEDAGTQTLDAQQTLAAALTHIFIAFRLGYLLGQGKI